MPSIQAVKRAPGLPSLNVGNASAETQYTVTGATPLILYVPGGGVLDKRPFKITIAGRANPGTSGNLTVIIYWGVSATIASNTSLASTGAVALSTTSGNFMLEAWCFYDSTSQRISGLLKGYVKATAVAQAIVTNVQTSVDLTIDTGTSYGFTATALFSASNASNSSYVDVFELEAL